jgi:CRP-like cAMP-binding protein
MKQEWLEILIKSDLFKEIPIQELNTMLECLKPKVCSYKKDEYITLAGEKFDGLGIVLSGSVVVTKENAAGSRIIMTILKPSEMFGEMAAFSDKRVWPATVYAKESCFVLFLPSGKIVGDCKKKCISNKMLILNLLRIVSNKALVLNRKVEYLTMKSIRGKISSFLLEQYKKTGNLLFMIPMNRNELADFLNVSRPSLSREMSRMRDEGIIEFYHASIRIKEIEGLKRGVDR